MNARRQLYAVEWTHGDGMDLHTEYAFLTPDEADKVRALLDRRDALQPCVFEPTALTYRDLRATIRADLPR